MTSIEMFVYSWANDEKESTIIRIYGLDSFGNNIVARVENFTPYCYIELPIEDCVIAKNKVLELIENLVLTTKILYKNHLYNEYNSSEKKPFLFCQCVSKRAISEIQWKLKYVSEKLKIKIHEESASSILQFTSLGSIPMAGWISFTGTEITDRQTTCDREYLVKWRDVFPSQRINQVEPKIFAFDFEVYSENHNTMPSDKPGDEIFQISCVITERQEKRKILLSAKGSDLHQLAQESIIVKEFDTEEDLIVGFIQLLKSERPNVLTGYNIFGFDLPYLIKRCNRYLLTDDLCFAGFNIIKPASIQKISWTSSAYRENSFEFLDWEGILILDLLPIIKRDYKLDNYKLNTVATEFLNAEKDPVEVKEIFQAFKTKLLARVGKYCIKDADLCIDLLNHLHCWISLVEMAKVCNVSMFTLYTQGQQIKIYSQVYPYCLRNDIIVDSDGYTCKVGERYTGAYVLEPEIGRHSNVCPEDFSSLYPSIMIAYNVCYSTFIPSDAIVDPNHCHEFIWEDHLGCQHDPDIIEINDISKKIQEIDERIKSLILQRNEAKPIHRKQIQKKINLLRISQKPLREQRSELKKSEKKDSVDDEGNVIGGKICAKRHYRFYKASYKKGVIPTIIQNLLDSRKRVKNLMKTCEPERKIVLDKEQLAYKVSANSQYGAMGVRRGYLPLMPGAMCVTFIGREAIKKSVKIITEKYRGHVIYGDTDSNYVIFPHIVSLTELWDYAEYVADQVSKEFPSPMKLEFEQAIYSKFLLLKKKKYMFKSITCKGGEETDKIGKKGNVLSRRDNSKFLKIIYEKIVQMIFNEISIHEIESEILEYINNLFRNLVRADSFIITKEVGQFEEESQGQIGKYKIRKQLPENDEERKKMLKGMTTRAYNIRQCPAHIRLAEKMRLRGYPVEAGTRLEYVVLADPNATTIGDRIEHVDYYEQHKDILRLDKLYYLDTLINPMDQLIEAGLKISNFVKKQYEYRKNFEKMLNKIRELGQPIFKIRRG